VSIYDREVSLARLLGSNKAYIEQTIPHISSLMKASIDSAVDDAEVVVVAKRSSEFEETVKALNNGHRVVDLVSVSSDRDEQKGDYEGICW
jgi:GDP-mannose 6-dehydrogenase